LTDVLPLNGRTIVVTRARHQADALGDKLAAQGAHVVYCPAIRIAPPLDPAPFQSAVNRIEQFDWLVLTSSNGVDVFMAELQRQGKSAAKLRALRIASVGPATAAALRAHGLEAAAMPDEFVSDRIAELITAQGGSGARILLARARGANPELPARLREAGAEITDVDSYRSVPDVENLAQLKALLAAHEIDAITFTSPSTAEYLVQGLRNLLAGVTLAAIGPVTAARVRELGLTPTIIAAEHTTDGLVQAIVTHYAAAEHGRR
jgi:uroporphyrinogen-III synthase